MEEQRLTQLILYYKEAPDDPFNVYALALEYSKSDPLKAKEYFDILLKHHENYVPAYYHAAKLYAELNQKDHAVKVYEKGIQMARKHNDLKAARELQSAYQELTFE